MHSALRTIFERQVEFVRANGEPIEDGVFIGATEILPVVVLRSDADAYRAEFYEWLNDVWIPEQNDRRSEILQLHGNSKRYTDLKKAVEKLQVVPVVGSGMSVPTGLPTWSDLLRRIRKFTTITVAELEALLTDSAFEEAADLLASGTNPNLLNERVEHDLRVDDPEQISGGVRLLPAVFSNLVLTTNLDDVLEQYYGRCEGGFDHALAGVELARYRQIKNPKERFLLKLHGDCRRAESRVLLKAEYEAAYAPGGLIREELTLLYRSHHLLFLGCSLGKDRTIDLVAEVAGADKNMPKHYAFLAEPETDDKRVTRENFLTKCGIYPIWYNGSHDECNTALLAGLLDKDGIGIAPLGKK
jgi:hypothetical protein